MSQWKVALMERMSLMPTEVTLGLGDHQLVVLWSDYQIAWQVDDVRTVEQAIAVLLQLAERLEESVAETVLSRIEESFS